MLNTMPVLSCVAPYMVTYLWPAICNRVDEAYQAVDATMPADLYNRLLSGRALAWIATDAHNDIIAVLITEIYTRRSGEKVCRMLAAAGEDVHAWSHFQFRIEEYAKAEGCDKVVAEGRPGWCRVLQGYSEVRRVIEKRI